MFMFCMKKPAYKIRKIGVQLCLSIGVNRTVEIYRYIDFKVVINESYHYILLYALRRKQQVPGQVANLSKLLFLDLLLVFIGK